MPQGESKRFEEILALAGDAGRWQAVLLLWAVLNPIISAAHLFSSIFIASVPEHHCSVPDGGKPEDWLPIDNATGKFSQCLIRAAPGSNVSLPCASYDYTMEEGIASTVCDWDLVCSHQWMISTVQAAYMLGCFCGAIITGMLADQFGRKNVAVGGWMLFLITAVSASFASDYATFTVLRFLSAGGATGTFGGVFILCMETIAIRWRALVGAIYVAASAGGTILLPAVAYFERRWRYIQLAISAPGVIVLAYYWVPPESPRWLIMQGDLEGALKVLKYAAAQNRRQLPQDDVLMNAMADFRASKVHQDQREPRSVLAKCADGLREARDLVRTPRMRRISLASWWNWISVSMVFFGLPLNAASLSKSPYLAILLSGLVEAPGVLLVTPLINRMGRRLSLAISHLISGVAILCILPLPAKLVWPKLLLGTVGKFSSSGTFSILFIYAVEYYPTQLRTMGVGASSMCARVGGLVAPYIVDLLSPIHWAVPSCVFGACALVAAAVALTLPETMGRRMPETVEDVEAGRWDVVEPTHGAGKEGNNSNAGSDCTL